MTVTGRRSQVIALNVALVVVGLATVASSLYLAANDRPLLGAAICFIGLLPAAGLTYAAARLGPPPAASQRVRRQRGFGFASFGIGLLFLICGGALILTAPGTLSTALLWTGFGLVVAGSFVFSLFRK